MKMPLGTACLAILAGIALANGCAWVQGLWSGDTPSISTCVVTLACSRDDVQTERQTICVGRDKQEEAEARLMRVAVTEMQSRGCVEPRAWAACYSDMVPCGP